MTNTCACMHVMPLRWSSSLVCAVANVPLKWVWVITEYGVLNDWITLFGSEEIWSLPVLFCPMRSTILSCPYETRTESHLEFNVITQSNAYNVYIYLFIIDPEDPMLRQISKVVGLQLVRYSYLVSDATLARQADRFVAVIISWCRPSTVQSLNRLPSG